MLRPGVAATALRAEQPEGWPKGPVANRPSPYPGSPDQYVRRSGPISSVPRCLAGVLLSLTVRVPSGEDPWRAAGLVRGLCAHPKRRGEPLVLTHERRGDRDLTGCVAPTTHAPSGR
jgi:hypothetical protein